LSPKNGQNSSRREGFARASAEYHLCAAAHKWYYRVGILRRNVRKDAGAQVAMSETVRQVILAQRPDCCHLKFVRKWKF
jgi:hypothetical protein